METVVEVRNLTKQFNGFMAVDDISFDISKGEIVGLMGPNGAGKTTTLHMLLGLTTPTGGKKKNRTDILSRVNFSSTYVSLPYSLTVEENLLVFSGLYSVKEPRKKILELLRTFDIEDIKDTPARKLSSGQMTRVSLSKCLLNDPEVLFLDEPLASLDPDIADRTRRLLKKIKEEKGLSILYTSHNMKETEEMCDRVIFLAKGKIVASGKPAEVVKEFGETTLEEVFLKIARKRP